MTRVVIYADTVEEAEGLAELFRIGILQRQKWPMIHLYIGNLIEYLQFVHGNPLLIMIAAVTGPDGEHIVRRIRENNQQARLVWLSNRENSMASWRVHVTSFGLLPQNGEEIERILDDCEIF